MGERWSFVRNPNLSIAVIGFTALARVPAAATRARA
jgi:hypothetical protein